MCFTVKYITQKKLIYAKRRSDSIGEINRIESELKELTIGMKPQFSASGFAHPPLLVFRNVHPLRPEMFQWGLVPHWVKDQKEAGRIRKKTLNARGESIFEKPSFKKAASHQRCLVMVDGFYDYHYSNNKAFPCLFQHRNKTPMVLAGLWDQCRTNNHNVWNTVTIVTTPAHGLIKEMQNNPKKKEQRSPLILNKHTENIWLGNTPRKQLDELVYSKANPDLEVSCKIDRMPGLWD
ncbi:Putative SOS response-associated peptidase YedK [Saccharicrinis carchari]|uniref:Abasic site processing protein n=1 Tax=Saccharicrinis carchari TaxID=1168039 RepID=A0A521CJY6_SACCC|nr:SOS response-associated peptidase family protein [Saccharicrinis carchari]SMO59722.1 Putative SOS response-associated peptidase YedK [Saccharicrinis carchari]